MAVAAASIFLSESDRRWCVKKLPHCMGVGNERYDSCVLTRFPVIRFPTNPLRFNVQES
jgi:hypothetical protein